MYVVSFVVVIISSVLVVKGSMITEDPPLCALLDAATQCDNFEIAKICTQLCTPAEDPPLCALLDAATQCENFEIAKLCTQLCIPAEDSPLCLLLDAATQCDNAEIAKICPNLCTPDKCPVSEGFLLSPDGTECYIAIRDEERSWSAADSFCKSEGMMLAQPADTNVAAWLQKTLHEKYGGTWNGHSGDYPFYWVGARGSGSGSYVWQQQQQQQQGGGGQVNTNMWAPGRPNRGGTTEDCVVMSTSDYYMRHAPGRPYYDNPCSWTRYPICQRVLV